MRIAVDAMGGDNAPASIIEGVIQAVKEYNYEIILVGDRNKIEHELSRYPAAALPITIRHTTEVIEETDSPAAAFRQKRNSSINVCSGLIKDSTADALVSAGNSGATMASSLATLKRLPGIARPAIATVMPTLDGMCVILDVGANVDCKPKNLMQFAIMGGVYIEHVYGKKNPRIGLLSIGKEENKGNDLTLATYGILKKSRINFIGNIEGGDIPKGIADVIVCDGFIGNVILKLAEGLGSMVMQWLKKGIGKNPLKYVIGPVVKSALKDIRAKADYDEYGGAPLLGINGACIVCHGISNAKAIKNSIKVAARFVEDNVNEHIKKAILAHEDLMGKENNNSGE
jgi:glycerol-3-phosphate acyltransferase PlsX